MDIATVLVGLGAGVVGGAATRINDSTRWRREARIDAYLKLGDAASAIADAGHDLYIFARDNPEKTDDARAQELRTLINDSFKALQSPHRAVELLGSANTVEMAFELQMQCELVQKLAQKDNKGFVVDWDERRMLLIFEFISQFTDAARIDLGVSERLKALVANMLSPRQTLKERRARRAFAKHRHTPVVPQIAEGDATHGQ